MKAMKWLLIRVVVMDFDVLRFLSDKNISYSETGSQAQKGWISVQCPFCGDAGDHGGFNIRKVHYYCWRCGGHSIPSIIKQFLGLTEWKDVYRIQYEYSTRSTVLDRLRDRAEKHGVDRVDVPGDPLQKMHIDYLCQRGYDPQTIMTKYRVRGEGIAGDYKYRIIIPILFEDEIVSFVARDVTGKQKLRYKNCPIDKSVLNPKHVLYNLDNCKEDVIVIVEGIFDVWRMGDGYAASLGTDLSPPQIRLLSKYKKIIFLFDNEELAQAKAKKYAYLLSSMGIEVVIANTETAKDPGELSPKEEAKVRAWINSLKEDK
jgi:hypothetical protein